MAFAQPRIPPRALQKLEIDVLSRTGFQSYSGVDYDIFFYLQRRHKKKGSSSERDFALITALQTISISSARSVHPVRRLGESHVTSYVAGARTIAGSLVFAVPTQEVFATLMSYGAGEKTYGNTAPFFVDQMPLFTVLIRGRNEYGSSSSCVIADLKLTNFGTTMSVDDIYTESTFSYVAKHYFPMVKDPTVFLDSLQRVGRTSPEPLSEEMRRNPDPSRTIHDTGYPGPLYGDKDR